jgi:uncharacterized membrane protein
LKRVSAALSDAAAGGLLLLGTGGAVGLALGTRFWVTRAEDFLLHNRVPGGQRLPLLVLGASFALALAAGPAFAWLAGRIPASRLREIAARLSPLLPAALASLLLAPFVWSRARLVHLVGCAVLAWLTQRCLRARALAPALAAEEWLARRVQDSALAGRARAAARRPALPALLVLAGALAYAAWFASVTLAAHWNGYTRSYDLAIFDNLMWNVVHGGEFLISTPASGGEHSHFGRHATLLAYGLAPFYALHASAGTLLLMQAILLGFAALPLFFFARIHLGPAAASALALAYLLYPPLHGSNLYDFHFLSISPFFVFCVAHALETRSRAWLLLSVLLTLTCREDVALGVALLGAYHVLAGRRVRAGLVLLGAGGAWFAVMKFVLMPLAKPGSGYAYIYKDLLPDGALGFGGVIQTLLSNPSFVLGSLLTQPKLEYALLIFTPLAFVPLRRPIGALFVLPGLLFTLLSTGYAPVLSIGYQYTAFWTPYLFVAATLLLRSDSFTALPAAEARAARRGWLGALTLLSLVCSYQYGAVFQQYTAGGGIYEVFPFETSELDLRRRQLRDEVLRALPPDATVAASESVAPHVSNRATAYTLREGVRDAEYVAFGLLPEAPGEQLLIRPLLVSGQFGVVTMNAGYALLRRGAPTGLNARLNGQLRFPAAPGAP